MNRVATRFRLRAIGRRTAWASLALVLAFSSGRTQAEVKSPWELSPYRIEIVVALDDAPGLGAQRQSDLEKFLVSRSETVVGAPWDVTAKAAPGNLRTDFVHRLADLKSEAIGEPEKTLDKIMAVGIQSTLDGYLVVVRDFDCRTRTWGVPVEAKVRQLDYLGHAAFHGMLKAFAPVVLVEQDPEDRKLMIKPRGSLLVNRDKKLKFYDVGYVFRPIVRRNDRQGNLLADGIDHVPWTLLTIETIKDDVIKCATQSGVRAPISSRKKGQVEQLALGIGMPTRPTRVELRSRTDEERGMEGYEIYVREQGSDKTIPLGRTDYTGSIVVPPGSGRFRTLFIRSGAHLMARLPIVPGLEQDAIAPIPDDSTRLKVEGYLAGMQERLVDTVCRREILTARVHVRLDNGKVPGAVKLFDELVSLPTREQLAQQLKVEQQQSVSADPPMQSKIDRLYQETQKLLEKYLDPRSVQKLRIEVDKARGGPAGKTAGP